MLLSMIVAHDINRGIGKDNKMPWHLPADFKYLKEVTTGHALIMGRSTFESIGKPLPKRRNIVITSQPDWSFEGTEVVQSLDEAVERCKDEEEAFIFGGSSVYEQAIDRVEKIYVTEIEAEFDADRYFPDYKNGEWKLTWEKSGTVDEKNKYPHTFKQYEREK
ncbi:dihydrofolate reductase [Geomicrobium sp. JCM 19055]|uniref:dihydrofolate reductase n=1 Tax=Geomicrobium sp. JCM 19055 TaxID=1460649 RepID=UPI00045EDB68|nr:dihydrofolate reductase [Geomicrobium sp. JCM 19055]GAK00378.1 dihydrofolate reductase [Geomicrobium sp. JCM 19055]